MADEIVALGILVSIVFTEITAISSSGLVAAGYIALALKNPYRIAYTLLVSLISYFIIKAISKYAIVFGKRQFALAILVAFSVNFVFLQFNHIFVNPGIIGIIVPGLMANEWLKQGVVKSVLALCVTVGITAAIMLIFNIPVF